MIQIKKINPWPDTKEKGNYTEINEINVCVILCNFKWQRKILKIFIII